LQSVLDEYAHMLLESEGLQESDRLGRAEGVTEVMREALATRSAPNTVGQIRVNGSQLELEDGNMSSHFAARYGRADTSDQAAQRETTIRAAFNSPFRPFVLASTSVGQEGLDFHSYSHAIVHWNLPGNPVDLEQREGRVHRYKGHAVRKNVAAAYSSAALNPEVADPWEAVFGAAVHDRHGAESAINPFWVFSRPGGAVIERYVPAMPLSRESQRFDRLRRTVGAYRLVIGQPRQEDLVRYAGELGEDTSWLRIDLTPPPSSHPSTPPVCVDNAADAVFDPEKDDPPIEPNHLPDLKGGGSQNQVLMADVMLIGGILAINLRQERGASKQEYKRFGERAGRATMKGAHGDWVVTRADGNWVTYDGRKKLENAARQLGLHLPEDLSW
jgi:hypothetical protein